MQNDNAKILDLAYEAGAILLENGAEISRVEDTIPGCSPLSYAS